MICHLALGVRLRWGERELLDHLHPSGVVAQLVATKHAVLDLNGCEEA